MQTTSDRFIVAPLVHTQYRMVLGSIPGSASRGLETESGDAPKRSGSWFKIGKIFNFRARFIRPFESACKHFGLLGPIRIPFMLAGLVFPLKASWMGFGNRTGLSSRITPD